MVAMFSFHITSGNYNFRYTHKNDGLDTYSADSEIVITCAWCGT